MSITKNIFLAALGVTLVSSGFYSEQLKAQVPFTTIKGTDFNLSWEIVDESKLPKTFWKDHIDRKWFDDSDPTEVKEYHISTPEQLAGLAVIVNSGEFGFRNKVIKIDADMDLSQHLWWAIGYHHQKPFTGTIDGQNHIIRGLRYNQGNAIFVPNNPDDKFSGFLGQCIGAKLLNLTFVGARMITMATSAVAVGNLYDGAEVNNCHVIDCYIQTLIKTPEGKPSYRGDVGGIGYAGILVGGVNKNSKIIDCTVKDSKFSGIDKCGAIAGGTWDGAIIKNTFAENVDIFSFGGNGTAGYVGTIMPFMATNNTEITNGYVTGRVACESPAASFIGGFVGRSGNLTVLNNCYSAVKVRSQLPDPITSYPVNIGGFSGQIIGQGPNDEVQNTFFDQEIAGVIYSMGLSRVFVPPFCVYGQKDEKGDPVPFKSDIVVKDNEVSLYLPLDRFDIPKDLKIYYRYFTVDEVMKWDQNKKNTYYPTAKDGTEYHKDDVIKIQSPQKQNYIFFVRAECPKMPENNIWFPIRFNDKELPFDSNMANATIGSDSFNGLRAGQDYPLPNNHGKLVGFNTSECKGQDALNMLNTNSDVTWKIDPKINNGYPYYRYNATLSIDPIQRSLDAVNCRLDGSVLRIDGNDLQAVKIYDMQGRLVTEHSNLGNIDNISMDASSLTGGVYLVVINTALGTKVSKVIFE